MEISMAFECDYSHNSEVTSYSVSWKKKPKQNKNKKQKTNMVQVEMLNFN